VIHFLYTIVLPTSQAKILKNIIRLFVDKSDVSLFLLAFLYV